MVITLSVFTSGFYTEGCIFTSLFWNNTPLVSRAVVVNLIGSTKTRTGLRINAELDTNTYKTGLKVTDEEFATIKIKKAKFHGEWNYTISPR